MKKIFCFLQILLFFSIQAFSIEPLQTKVLFVVQDAGETNAFLPLMQLLDEKKLSFHILAGGVAEEILRKNPSFKDHLAFFSDFGIKADKEWDREKQISQEKLSEIVSSYHPEKVICGVAFAMQGQILHSFKKDGVRTFAFWDNFSENGDNLYFTVAHKVVNDAEVLLLPSQILAGSTCFQKKTRQVVGQPSLDTWRRYLPAENWHEKLKLSPDKKHICYVGGYGRDYEEAFILFLQKLEGIDFSRFTVLVLPHPKTDGSFEKGLIKKSEQDVQVLVGYPTRDMVAVSDLLICHQSTVGMQALSIPKPVLFLMPASQKYQNFLIEKGWVRRLSEKDDLGNEIKLTLEKPAIDLYSLMGIPEKGAETFFQALFNSNP